MARTVIIFNIRKYFLIVPFLAGILSACQPQVEYPVLPKENRLEHKQKMYTLMFLPGKKKLPSDEQEILRSLLKTKGPGKASAHVTLPPSQRSFLSKERLKYTVALLKQMGVKENQIHFDSSIPQPAANSLTLLIDYYRVIPPICPDWSVPLGRADQTISFSNYGCATQRNFALMISDPIILFRGEQPDFMDGEHATMAIKNYRTGKTKSLKAEQIDDKAAYQNTSPGS